MHEYEECERERTCYIDCGDYRPSRDGLNGWYEKAYAGQHLLVFDGCEEHFRKYSWS